MLETFRTALLITLSILVVFLLVQRFKKHWRQHHMPIPRHMELLALEVVYHPTLLRITMAVPAPGELFPALLSAGHERLHAWPPVQLDKGEHVLELALDPGLDGAFFFEISTGTQRTERRFLVRQA
ncbi:MAG: hypothetical protein KBH07_06805 [Flavobacteriales bacterium]|nr:hypothetical protein [Flavobacteriales bacterium]MBP9080862.1 hypothetical protein [Flavobacteriales bacterium]